MEAIQWIAEQRIREAINAGEFEDVPGHGLPLLLTPEPATDDGLKYANHILKNAGFLPLRFSLKKEIEALQEKRLQLLQCCRDRLQKGRARGEAVNIVAVKLWRDDYLSLLQETNRRLSTLASHQIQEEIRAGTIMTSSPDALDVAAEMRRFDDEFLQGVSS